METRRDEEMKEEIEEAKEYPLSDGDIQRLLPVDTNIFTYPQLENITHIDEVFDPHGRAIMLFLTEDDTTGHWIALIRRGSTIEIYDPYGNAPSQWKKKLGGSMEDNRRWRQNRPLLENKVKEAGYKLLWNKEQHQPVSKDINTCGRHSAMRLLFADYSLPEYNRILKKIYKGTGIDADTLATALTQETLGK